MQKMDKLSADKTSKSWDQRPGKFSQKCAKATHKEREEDQKKNTTNLFSSQPWIVTFLYCFLAHGHLLEIGGLNAVGSDDLGGNFRRMHLRLWKKCIITAAFRIAIGNLQVFILSNAKKVLTFFQDFWDVGPLWPRRPRPVASIWPRLGQKGPQVCKPNFRTR